MKKISIFFCTVFAALMLTFIVFAVLVNFCGRGVCEQQWFKELYPLKKHMAKAKKSPKIIIIGGSSSLFGISGKKLHEYTGMDNINFSMSILMPMRFYLVDLEKHVGKGDIVVLPLELTKHYHETAEKNFSNFGISLLFGCMPDAQKTLSFSELCSLYFCYGFSWINTSLLHKDAPLRRLFTSRDKQGIWGGTYKEKYVANQWAQLQTKDKRGTMGYFSDLSTYGDWLVDQPGRDTETPPFPLFPMASEEFVFSYKRIQELVKSRGATLLLVWPNIYFYAEQGGFDKWRVGSKGITIYGRPESVSFPKHLYHDPIAHMNIHGAELWTYELAKTICKATGRPLKKRNQAWAYIVFADNPSYYFPGVKSVREYYSGVQIGQKEFPLVLDIPEDLRGKTLEMSLIVKPDIVKSPAFAAFRLSGKSCTFEENIYSEHHEVFIHIPPAYTNQEKMELSCSIRGKEIGMERIFIREEPGTGKQNFHTKTTPQAFNFISGFSFQEEWGRWVDGTRGDFTFEIPRKFRKKNLKLTFDLHTFVHPKKPICKFRLLTQGKILKEMTSKEFIIGFSIHIPAEMTANGKLPLTFENLDPCSPKALGIGDDPRRLGIGLCSIAVETEKKRECRK